jgi:hypothetical protein
MPADLHSPPPDGIDSDSTLQPGYRVKHRQYADLIFGSSCLVSSWIAAGVAVYILGLADEVVGQDGTFQALLLATALSSLAATVGFSLMAAAVIPMTFYLYKVSLGSPPSIIPALLLTAGTGAIASFLMPRTRGPMLGRR